MTKKNGRPIPLHKKFPGNLKAARERAGLSQAKLASRARLSLSYVSMLERGDRQPPLDTLERLARRGLKMDPILLLA